MPSTYFYRKGDSVEKYSILLSQFSTIFIMSTDQKAMQEWCKEIISDYFEYLLDDNCISIEDGIDVYDMLEELRSNFYNDPEETITDMYAIIFEDTIIDTDSPSPTGLELFMSHDDYVHLSKDEREELNDLLHSVMCETLETQIEQSLRYNMLQSFEFNTVLDVDFPAFGVGKTTTGMEFEWSGTELRLIDTNDIVIDEKSIKDLNDLYKAHEQLKEAILEYLANRIVESTPLKNSYNVDFMRGKSAEEQIETISSALLWKATDNKNDLMAPILHAEIWNDLFHDSVARARDAIQQELTNRYKNGELELIDKEPIGIQR